MSFKEAVDTMTDIANDLISRARASFAQASDAASLENAKAIFLGKQGSLTELLKGLAKLDPEQKRIEGARINVIKQEVEALLNDRRRELADAQLAARLALETIDVTLPGRGRGEGRVAPDRYLRKSRSQGLSPRALGLRCSGTFRTAHQCCRGSSRGHLGPSLD